jgi:uncharacterized protein (DUF2141 family)
MNILLPTYSPLGGPRFHGPRFRSVRRAAFALATGLSLTAGAQAADLVVRVTGIMDPLGQIGCALFASPAGFPLDTSNARQLWLLADPKGVTCRFDNVPEGTYAVSIGHDINGNRRVDTNFVGMPTEQWGVSNNVRTTLRAPRFDEAAFKVAADAGVIELDLKVAK